MKKLAPFARFETKNLGITATSTGLHVTTQVCTLYHGQSDVGKRPSHA